MNEQMYKILIIDDSAEDRVTFRYYLEKNKEVRYEFLEAELGDEGLEICRAEKPDCVLLDYNLPDSDGLSVMREINADPLNPEFPIVLLTGSGSEVIAVNALKNGAQDYLVKGKITPEDLHLSIQKAIETVKLRNEKLQALADLRQSEARLKLGIRVADFAVIEVNYSNNTTHLSKDGARLFGFGDEEMTVPRERVHQTFHPDEKDELEKLIEKSLDPNGDGWFEKDHRIVLENGETRWLSVRKQIFFDRKSNPPRPTHGILAAQDITPRKKAEEQLRLYEKVVVNTKDAVMITEAEPIDSPGPRILYVNPAFTEMSGYTPEEVIGQSPRILQGAKTDRKQLDKIRAALTNWESVRVELTNYHKDGTEFVVEFDINPVADENGWFTHWVSVQRDVTERKRSEIRLNESKQLLQGTMDALTSHIAILDKNGVIVSVNEAWRRFAIENNFQAENFGIGQKYFETYNPQDVEAYDRHADRAVEGLRKVTNGEIESFVLEYPCHSNNEECWFVMRVTCFNRASDELRVVVAHENITTRKIAEDKLRVSEERLSLAMKGANIGTFDWNIKTDEIIWSHEIEEASELTTDDFNHSFEGLIKLVHPLDREILQSRIEEGFKVGEYECEFRLLKGDGTIRWVLGKGRVMYDETGEPARLLGVDIDITNRKLTEEKLRENQIFTERIIETAPSVIYTFDLNTKTQTFVTKQAAAILGYTFEEYKEISADIFRRFMHPDDTAAAKVHFEKIKRANSEEVFELEYRMRHKSGEWRWFRSRDMVFKRGENGEAQEILGVALDITERKNIAEKLRESRERMEATNTNAPIGIVETTLDGKYLSVNDEFCRITGYTKDELLKLNLKDLTHTEDFPLNFKLFQRLVAGKLPSFQSEKRFVRKDGSEVWVEDKRTLLKHADGKPSYVVGAVIDINERKKAEDLLRRNHDTFFNLIENAPFGIYIIDSEFKLMQISKGSRKVFSNIESPLGRDFTEVIRILWEEPFASEVISRFRHTLDTGEQYRAAASTEQRGDIEETESYDWKIERITLPDGNFGVVCYFYDLTERLQFEEKLRESEERMRLVLNAAKIGIWIYDFADENIFWSPEHYEIFETQEFDGTIGGFFEFVHPDDVADVWSQFNN